ncbi:hypothetical protein LZ30DRAFT_460638 [Colletotrichum cereale]|nr:hypothetical protein LZ30DRAFT_460638 [Colletotrichum cereale]
MAMVDQPRHSLNLGRGQFDTGMVRGGSWWMVGSMTTDEGDGVAGLGVKSNRAGKARGRPLRSSIACLLN